MANALTDCNTKLAGTQNVTSFTKVARRLWMRGVLGSVKEDSTGDRKRGPTGTPTRTHGDPRADASGVQKWCRKFVCQRDVGDLQIGIATARAQAGAGTR